MKRISVLMVLLLAVASIAAQKTVTPVEVNSLGALETIASWQVVYPSDSTAKFVNDKNTFVVLYSTTGNRTFTITKPFEYTNVPGLGIVTIDDIEVTTTFGKMTFLQIPTLYNSSGYATVKSDSISGGRIAVFRLRGN